MAKAVRLDKFLADAGKGTRSEVKKYIQKGQVQVNGTALRKPEQKIDPEKDVITFAGEKVSAAPEFVYYLLNKPAGCVSATEDRNDRTVMEYVPSERKGLFPVGRLDKDTEGLLLITDDGMLAHELLAPGKHVDKTYFVRVEGKLTVENIRKLENGVDIGEEKLTMPAKVRVAGGSWMDALEGEDTNIGRVRRENLPEIYTELYLTIHEGKFHQVKRMMAAVGTPVIYLKRVSMGSLNLPDDLKKGECRLLTEKEVEELKQSGKH